MYRGDPLSQEGLDYEALRAKSSDRDTKPYTPMKLDNGKAPMDLLPWKALYKVAQVLGFGKEKYEERGWYNKCETTDDVKRYEAALLRHYSSHKLGEKTDPESGYSHLAHLACNALFILELADKELKEN